MVAMANLISESDGSFAAGFLARNRRLSDVLALSDQSFSDGFVAGRKMSHATFDHAA
jgi:hypothetical protein